MLTRPSRMHAAGNTYMCGSSNGNFEGHAIPLRYTTSGDVFPSDVWVMKFGPDGVRHWIRFIASLYHEECTDMAVDAGTTHSHACTSDAVAVSRKRDCLWLDQGRAQQQSAQRRRSVSCRSAPAENRACAQATTDGSRS
jgi:hypothetical protein